MQPFKTKENLNKLVNQLATNFSKTNVDPNTNNSPDTTQPAGLDSLTMSSRFGTRGHKRPIYLFDGKENSEAFSALIDSFYVEYPNFKKLITIENTARFYVTIDDKGEMIDCKIPQISGTSNSALKAALDREFTTYFQEHGQWIPVYNKEGIPVAGKTFAEMRFHK